MTRTAVPRPTPNECALHRLMCTPVCERMIRYLAYLTSEVVRCEGDQQLDNVVPPTTTTDSTRHIRRSVFEPPLPRLELFVDNVIKNSRVRVPTLITIPIYLSRLRQRLRPEDRGVKSTPHRIFLATLILASKNSNDAFLSNKQWAEWTTVGDFGFSLTEVNTMERELLFYLDWNLRITSEDLYYHLELFFAPIRTWQARAEQPKVSRKAQTLARKRRHKTIQEHVPSHGKPAKGGHINGQDASVPR